MEATLAPAANGLKNVCSCGYTRYIWVMERIHSSVQYWGLLHMSLSYMSDKD